MANDIKDFSRVIAELEDGQFNVDCSSKVEEALKALRERCDVDGAKTAVAAMAIKLKIILNSGNIEIHADVSSSTPARSAMWSSRSARSPSPSTTPVIPGLS